MIASGFSVTSVPIPEEEEDTADTPRGHSAGVIWSRGSGMAARSQLRSDGRVGCPCVPQDGVVGLVFLLFVFALGFSC